MVNERVHHYLREGLEATPIVLGRLLERATEEIWDRRPDPQRFTPREAIAHLADWEPIWSERLERLRTEVDPLLPSRDPDQLAKEHDYANAQPRDSLRRFQEGRAQLLQRLAGLAPHEWGRTGRHGEIGTISIQDLAQLILGHDGYHLRQVAELID